MRAGEIRRGLLARQFSAEDVARDTLTRIARANPAINAFTTICTERALREARAIDKKLRAGEVLPPLAGVPYAVKNLFDIEGLTTLAGARMREHDPAAILDATAIARIGDAGGVLTGALNMDEHAYGFTTENSHYGATCNPHDVTRIAGGSSGGSAAAVAAGLTPLALGSDTNGSIRVPASLCGVWGLKPTFGRLSRAGTFPFVANLDHIGPFASGVADLALAYDAMQGPDARDPATASSLIEPITHRLNDGVSGLRVARLTGYFDDFADEVAHRASLNVARALSAVDELDIADVMLARSAAFLITACEGGALHLADLRIRGDAFDPNSRERLMAGALCPSAWYLAAQRYRRLFRDRILNLFQQYDVLIAPATPCAATRIGDESFTLNGEMQNIKATMGILTQPISFVGLPVIAAPVTGGALPIGVQLITAPWREDVAFRVAYHLEQSGICAARITNHG